MPRPRKLKPDYCRDKSSGRAFVTLNGHRRYLGDHGTQASRDEMIKLGWCRQYVNRQILRVKTVFKWAVANELLEPRVMKGCVTTGRTASTRTASVGTAGDPLIASSFTFRV